MLVKICGITRLEDARAAADAGAGGAVALGFIFWPGSPRYISHESAAAIVRRNAGRVQSVGVFVDQLPEEVMLGGVVYGHQQMQAVIELIHQLVEEAGKPLWDWQPPAKDEALIAQVASIAENDMREAYRIRSKQARSQRLAEIETKVQAACVPPDADGNHARHVGNVLFDLEARIVRQQILSGDPPLARSGHV